MSSDSVSSHNAQLALNRSRVRSDLLVTQSSDPNILMVATTLTSMPMAGPSIRRSGLDRQPGFELASPRPGLGEGIILGPNDDFDSISDPTSIGKLTPAGGWEGIPIRSSEGEREQEKKRKKEEEKKQEAEKREEEKTEVGRKKRSEGSDRKKRSAEVALGADSPPEQRIQVGDSDLPEDVVTLSLMHEVERPMGDGSSDPSSFPYDFLFEFKGNGKHIYEFSDEWGPVSRKAKLEERHKSVVASLKVADDSICNFQVEMDKLNFQVEQTKANLEEAEEGKKSDVARVDSRLEEMRSVADVEVARTVLVSKAKLKAAYEGCLKLMELCFKALVEKSRLSSLASQVYGELRRLKKMEEEGLEVDAAKKRKFEGELATYQGAADALVIPSFPGEDGLVTKHEGDACEDESSEGTDSNVEEESGWKTYGNKVPSAAQVEIAIAATNVDQVGEEGIDLTTRQPLAPLFDYPELGR
ncbi:hypothetical protein AALP_AA6G228300 [Arabis alpina]|uniref:Uncharacterized protein n=1 Tax=Arabis alpina TaxID=50452 RepID=A0A087GR32_ARAAL|nr:hypothetical protein AALP_AA6G228300 [Arabis alpina]